MQKIDSNFIYLKSENTRMQLTDMSHLLKKSPQRLKYIQSTMEKEGILTQPYALIDYSFFGLILFRVYFKGGYISENDRARIVRSLAENDYVTSIYELTSDLVVEFASPNPSRFNKELRSIAALAKTLTDYQIVLNLVTYMLPRKYLTSRSTLQNMFFERIIGGDRPKELFSDNEMGIFRLMLREPDARIVHLAEETGMNPRTVKTTMQKLMDRKILRGIYTDIDLSKIGYNRIRLFLKLHNLEKRRERELVKFCINANEVVQLNKTVGDWDMEIDLEVSDSRKSRLLVMQLRENFRDLIARFDLTEFYTFYKRSYLPQFLFRTDADEHQSEGKV